ncbi:RHS repeat domain-containing protein [Pseudomonas sp. HK3]|jgi:RHS repeat-associated protein
MFISKIVKKLNWKKKQEQSCSGIKITFLSLMLLAVNALAAGTPTYIHSDHLGSPVMATNADGSIKWQKRYQPFGSVMQEEDIDNSVGFTGHVQDKTLDLNYMQARWYNPELGRFLSIDPVGYEDGNTHSFNRYSYANNNPYKYVDPDGQIAKLVKLAWNIGKKAYKNGGDFKKAGKDEWQDIVENAAELLDGDFTSDDVFAAVDLLTGFGKELKSVTRKSESARDALANSKKRKHATYAGGHKDGKIVSGCSSNPSGCAEDDIARQLGSDAKMTGAKGFRRNKTTGELEYKDIPVCTNCQSKYSKSQFPSDVKYDSGGTWNN